MPRRHGPRSKKMVLARERERQAFELRKAGATYEQIAQAIQPHDDGTFLTVRAVSKMLKRVLDRTIEQTTIDADAVRHIEVERLDAMLLGVWQQAKRGDGQAIDRVLKIMKRRADLLGLDAPEKQEITGADGKPIEGITVRFVKPGDVPEH